MWSGCAIDEHRSDTRNWHVESTNICLPVLKGYVSTVYTTCEGRTRRFRCALGSGMIAIAELELDDISQGGDNGIWSESVLRATDNDWNQLICAWNYYHQR